MAKKTKLDEKVWVIAYINRDYLHTVDKELHQYEYSDVKVLIPTIKILKKKFKGKDHFDEVPLLFNYGFFGIPIRNAINPEYLNLMRQRVTCLYGWVKDITEMSSHANFRMDQAGIKKALSQLAIAKDEEVARLIEESDKKGIHDARDINNLIPGQLIQLKGYPFDNMDAEVLQINKSKKVVKVMLDIQGIMREAEVSFDNVFYTVYEDFDKSQKEKSLEEISENRRTMDKILFKHDYEGRE